MSERFEPGITPESVIKKRPYSTLRGTVIKSTAFLALGGAIVSGYAINKVRQEESSTNQEKARIVRQFNETNSNPNTAQLWQLQNEVNSVNKFSKTSIILTTAGSSVMALSLQGLILSYFLMPEESRSPNKKKREDQPLAGTL